MAAPSKAFTTIPDVSIDADSPWHEDIVEDFRDNDIHLQEAAGDEALYGTRQKDHIHDGLDGSAPIRGASGGVNLVVATAIHGNENDSAQVLAAFKPSFIIAKGQPAGGFIDIGIASGTLFDVRSGTGGVGTMTAGDAFYGGFDMPTAIASGEHVNFLMGQNESSYISTGDYIGDGAASRTFNIGFQPDLVIVMGTGAPTSAIRTTSFSGLNSRSLDGTWQGASSIIDFGATGFSVGSNLNITAVQQRFIAIKGDITIAGEQMELENYTGNGVSGANTDTDLSAAADKPPQAVIIVNTVNTGVREPYLAFQAMPGRNSDFNLGNANNVQTFHATGVTLGAGDVVNTNTESYDIAYFRGGRP